MFGKHKVFRLPIIELYSNKDHWSNVCNVYIKFDVRKLHRVREQVDGKWRRMSARSMLDFCKSKVEEMLPFAEEVMPLGWVDYKCHTIIVSARILIADKVTYVSLWGDWLKEMTKIKGIKE